MTESAKSILADSTPQGFQKPPQGQPEPELTPAQIELIRAAEQQFEEMCEDRHRRGNAKYGVFCTPPETPIWMSDGNFKPIGEVEVGDYVIGWTETSNGPVVQHARVLDKGGYSDRLIRTTLASGTTIRHTANHKWRNGYRNAPQTGNLWVTIYPNAPFIESRSLAKVVQVPQNLTQQEQRAADWLGGIIDGEGHVTKTGLISISQSPTHNPEVFERIKDVLKVLDLDYTESTNNTGPEFWLRGGRDAQLKILIWCSTVKATPRLRDILCHEGRRLLCVQDHVVNVEREERPSPALSLQTTTGNYIAYGYASSNTFLENPTLEMALEELADLANYARYTFIKVVLLRHMIKHLQEQGIHGASGFFTTEQILGIKKEV